MKIVVALGGNALARRGQQATADNLRANVREAMADLSKVALEHQLVITHGNGPQVGLLALQNLAYSEVESYPLDILGAETQGMLGYVIGQELMNAIGMQRHMVTILTTTVVREDDPAFARPTKFVGPVYSKSEAEEFAAKYDWTIAQDGQHWRRVVPSPEPVLIRQSESIERILKLGLIVLCGGGGGVPVVIDSKTDSMHGVEAVVDKDASSAVLARDIGADMLLLLTDGDAVCLDWGTPDERAIRTASPAALREFNFAEGSMGPKVAAAAQYAEATGGEAVIGSLDKIAEILTGRSGTRISPPLELSFYE